ncbi:phosphoribosylformylglycinamidine synthase subunit PurS [Lactococcus garvieae]|uniref:Phosphoribosylformylglycinamidine synthase subunit PurS n=1 Tax=Lactococcus garvieae TaxID=1363 RepID=A0A6L2ZXL9_9LACT|nr:phosphoribosylformylglycinamidine synthase subunit PurS [Lactococcus garvieae]GFO52240.1 phosphoribosylformylglycinamidine synthase subunit PurS [Lactococcus garvieae]
MSKVEVYVTYKKSILDPQGQAIKAATQKLGYSEIQDIRVGKYFEIEVEGERQMAVKKVEEIAEKLLANPNMETYKVEVVD